MVFWIFKRNYHYDKIKKEVDGIHSRLHTSFSNIKKDMQNINAWLEDHDIHKEELRKELKLHKSEVKNQFDHLQRQINSLHSVIETFNQQEEVSEDVPEVEAVKEPVQLEPETILPTLETLTDTQKLILRALLANLNESGRKSSSYKEIAEELYPDKEYSKVRPTISTYLNHIEELGLISRKRIGKDTYITVTDFGKKVIKNIKEKKKEQKILTKSTK